MKQYHSNKKQLALKLAVLSFSVMPIYQLTPAEAADSIAKSRDIIVTANKTQAEVKAVPQAAEVITAEDIKNTGADNVISALRLANNINLSEAGMTGNQVSLRGNSTKHTLILVDGKRLSGEDTDSTANVYALQRLNVHNIERIEIVRGNASVLYGSDALGGVINIITKAPTANSFTIGSTTGTKEMSNYYHADFISNDNFSGTFDANFSKTRNYTPTSDSNMFGPRQFFDFKGIYDFKNANKNKITFNLNYFNEHLRENYADKKSASGQYFYSQNKKEYFDSKGYGASLAYAGKTSKNDFEYRFYWNKLDKDTHYNNERAVFPGMMENILGAMYPKYDYDIMNFSNYVFEAKDTMYADDYHTLTFGGEYRHTSYEGTRLGGSSSHTDKKIESHSFDTYSAYMEDMWQYNDRFLFTPSLRYEHNSMFGSNLVGKFGATYNANKTNRLKFTFGRGYKAPTVSELYLNMNRNMGMMNVIVYGNPDLKPEKSLNFDASYEAEFGHNVGWSKLTYYYNKISNLIDAEDIRTTSDITNNIYRNRYYNVGKAMIQGYETEIGTHLNKLWDLKFNFNAIDAINAITGARLNNQARYKTTISLNYDDHKDNGFTASIWQNFVNDYHYSDKDYDYSTFNFSLRKKFTPHFSMSTGIDNLFNHKEYDIYMYGRVWRLGAEWIF